MGPLTHAAAATPLAVHGAWTHELSIIETEGGPVLHMLRADSPLFSRFGEIYFSVVHKGAVKAWKNHLYQSQNLAVPQGLVEMVIYDGRENSPTFGTVESLLLGRPAHYRLLHIPPGLWYGFAGRSEEPAILANCADTPHSAAESRRLPADSPLVPYSWKN